MLVFYDCGNATIYYRKARQTMIGLSDRKIDETIDKLSTSKKDLDRKISIAMRAILMGDDERAFAKACKMHTKTTSERIRYR